MKSTVETIQDILVSKAMTVATAESCTGGLLAVELTKLSGSSAVYLGGVASYSNFAKELFLDVPPSIIESCGAVSKETAEAMAAGVQRKLSSTYAVSLTGIAGPTGGTDEKPVGTVWCGVASPRGVRAQLLDLSEALAAENPREAIRNSAAEQALRLLLEEIGDNS